MDSDQTNSEIASEMFDKGNEVYQSCPATLHNEALSRVLFRLSAAYTRIEALSKRLADLEARERLPVPPMAALPVPPARNGRRP